MESRQLNADRIAAALSPERIIGNEIEVLAETGSTNDEIVHRANAGAAEGLVVFAEWQRRGRGRRGDPWVSPRGKDLLLSVLLRPEGPPGGWTWLTHGAAVAICRVIEALFQIPAQIKWPNDVYLAGNRKVSGILLETRTSGAGGAGDVVLGIGINVNGDTFPGELAETAISLKAAAGAECDLEREILAGAILAELDAIYGLEDREKPELMGEAERRSVFLNRELEIQTASGRHRGRFLGLGAGGELVLVEESGLRRVYSGAEAVQVTG